MAGRVCLLIGVLLLAGALARRSLHSLNPRYDLIRGRGIESNLGYEASFEEEEEEEFDPTTDLENGRGRTALAWHAPRTIGAGGKKDCLCRFIYNRVEVVDKVYFGVKDKCGDKCLAFIPDTQKYMFALCHVYKRRIPKNPTKVIPWVLANKQFNKGAKICHYSASAVITDWEQGNALSQFTGALDSAGVMSQRRRISFFWWGNPVDQKYHAMAKAGANLIKTLLGDNFLVEYYYQNTASAFKDGTIVLNDDIVVNEVTQVGNFLKNTDLSYLKKDIDNVVGFYQRLGAKSFAAIKDLAILCILYKNGGFFFDTNMKTLNDGDDTSLLFAQQLATNLDAVSSIALPRYPTLRPRTDLNEGQELHLSQGTDGQIVTADLRDHDFDQQMFKLEYNAGFAPKGHPATRYAIENYIALAKIAGCYLTDDTDEIDAALLKFSDASKWNVYVGETIRAAVDGGIVKHAYSNNINKGKYVFDANKIGEELRISTIGLTKVYGNTWRAKAT